MALILSKGWLCPVDREIRLKWKGSGYKEHSQTEETYGMAVEPQELNGLFPSHNWPTKQTSLRQIMNSKQSKWKEEQTYNNLPIIIIIMSKSIIIHIICLLSCMILVGAVGFSTASQQETVFFWKRSPEWRWPRESSQWPGKCSKTVVAAAAKKQRGKMGVAPWRHRDENGEECKRKVGIGKMV